MSQRFYSYTPRDTSSLLCEHPNCVYLAVWWDSYVDAVWCDFHATAEALAPVRVQCAVCLQSYNPSHIHNGVCVDCRSVMPLMWTDDGVMQ